MTRDVFTDVIGGLKRADLWAFLAWQDIRQRYRRSSLGPFWITLATLLTVGGMTLVYAGLFKQDMKTFLPWIATGIVVWGLISGCLIEGSNVFVSASNTIKQVPAPLTVHVFRLVWNQLIYFLHNFVVIVIALTVSGVGISRANLFFGPALLLLLVNLGWATLLLGTVSARFRDVPLIVQSIITAVFLMTPVMWRAEFLPPGRQWVAFLNPFTYLLDIVRRPLLGEVPPMNEWLIVGALAVCGWGVALAIYGRCRHRIAFWI